MRLNFARKLNCIQCFLWLKPIHFSQKFKCIFFSTQNLDFILVCAFLSVHQLDVAHQLLKLFWKCERTSVDWWCHLVACVCTNQWRHLNGRTIPSTFLDSERRDKRVFAVTIQRERIVRSSFYFNIHAGIVCNTRREHLCVSVSKYLFIYIHTYIYITVCVWVCYFIRIHCEAREKTPNHFVYKFTVCNNIHQQFCVSIGRFLPIFSCYRHYH